MKKALTILGIVFMISIMGFVGYVNVRKYVDTKHFNERVEYLYEKTIDEIWNNEKTRIIYSELMTLENGELKGIITYVDRESDEPEYTTLVIYNGVSYHW